MQTQFGKPGESVGWLVGSLRRTLATLVVGFSVLAMPGQAQTPRRPVYIVAHRCNTANWAVNAIKNQGVNGIEADFIYGRPNVGAAKDWYLAHDDVLPSSVRLRDWLTEVGAEAARPGTPLAFLHVDIKSPDAPLEDLYDQLRQGLPKTNLLFDIGVVKNGVHLARIKSRIMGDSRAVASMGFDDSPEDVKAFFQKEGWPIHKYWYEIGIAAGGVWSGTEQQWTKDAIKARNAGTGPKVVIWTFEKESTVKSWLNEGVDAILVNSSEAYGRTNALATDADVHVANAKVLKDVDYGQPSSIAFPAPQEAAAAPSEQPARSKPVYQVTIKTGDKTGAGTDSNIFLTIGGSSNQSSEIRLNGLLSGNAFERNQIDTVKLTDQADLGTLQTVKIRSDDRYPGSSWYLESVTINGQTARFDCWVESGKLTVERRF